MQLSPLILKQHFVTNISVKASVPNFASTEELVKAMGSGMSNILTKVESAKNEENSRLWKVGLIVSCRPSAGTNFCPYLIDAELLGFFEVHPSVEDSAIEDLVVCNGPAILFGALRELVLLITGRGPMPAFSLPSVSFIDGSKENRKKAAEAQSEQLEKRPK
jgi:preprotein translocase subunit SecB